jgi:hypothetical protein
MTGLLQDQTAPMVGGGRRIARRWYWQSEKREPRRSASREGEQLTADGSRVKLERRSPIGRINCDD